MPRLALRLLGVIGGHAPGMLDKKAKQGVDSTYRAFPFLGNRRVRVHATEEKRLELVVLCPRLGREPSQPR
jgi:hypothetical protein